MATPSLIVVTFVRSEKEDRRVALHLLKFISEDCKDGFRSSTIVDLVSVLALRVLLVDPLRLSQPNSRIGTYLSVLLDDNDVVELLFVLSVATLLAPGLFIFGDEDSDDILIVAPVAVVIIVLVPDGVQSLLSMDTIDSFKNDVNCDPSINLFKHSKSSIVIDCTELSSSSPSLSWVPRTGSGFATLDSTRLPPLKRACCDTVSGTVDKSSNWMLQVSHVFLDLDDTDESPSASSSLLVTDAMSSSHSSAS